MGKRQGVTALRSKRPSTSSFSSSRFPRPASLKRAGNGTRTRDPNLGKVVLYQLSYSREPVPTDAPAGAPRKVEARGIEPLTS